MTAKNRTTIKSVFEQGDTPQGTDYVDWIDSSLFLANTTAQSISSPISVTGAISASTTVSANTVEASAASFTAASAASLTTDNLVVTTTARVSGNMFISGNLDVGGTLEIVQGDVGELYIEATAAVSASASFVEIISTATADSTFLVNFTVSAGSLVYGGSVTRNFLALASISLYASANNTETFLAFGIDGSALARTQEVKSIGTSDDEMSLHSMVRLSQNERVSLMLKGSAAAADGWAIKDLVLTVKQ